MPKNPLSLRRFPGPVRTLVSCLTAVALAVTGIYLVGPWSSGSPVPTGRPRPIGKPVDVPGRTVTVLGAGDILVHPELWDQARRDGRGQLDFAPMLAPARSAVESADLALCHLETPVAPPGGPYIGFPRFSVPREVVQGIKSVGYDGCSTASNHSIDQGYDGVKRTLDALDAAGLGHTGTYRTARDATRPRIYPVDGVRIAHLSYTKSFNGLRPAAGQAWIANLIDTDKIKKDAARARAVGAEIVVVSLHWGTEYEHEPDADQQTWAREVAELRNVDLVFGHHAHVVQPVERIGDKWIVYGMGNQIARHAEPVNANRDGAMVRVTFGPAGVAKRWKVRAVEALPTFVDLNPDIRLIDLEQALADPALSPGRRRIYEAAVERIQGNLLTRAAGEAGLVVRGTGG
ncbi:CapA family protein [Micromonospora inyonensis]|uniref:Poly-gamma-glutamate synthesis protein (Capsule biosynthesis protein) n=1 Tax=Micromonospora inyonensis TaxID=47866 RepID=A0A1C6RGT0_9ACTN|nr:CapA family protein [Micromonospora inyonensis]SCL16392.1 poly-gamma-glutamate synthesis protein (capsule biosynthesis protein) [Micromonospora inyonensis]